MRPYDFDGKPPTAHPADSASPPLQDGDQITAVNGVAFGRAFDKCKGLIRESGSILTLTVQRAKVADAEVVGAHLGDWNVATGDASLFVSAHALDTAAGGPEFGLLLTVTRVAEGSRFALAVPTAALRAVTAKHFGASLLARDQVALGGSTMAKAATLGSNRCFNV